MLNVAISRITFFLRQNTLLFINERKLETFKQGLTLPDLTNKRHGNWLFMNARATCFLRVLHYT